MQKIDELHTLSPIERLIELNIGDRRVVSNILSQSSAVVKSKLKNPFLFTIQDLLKLAGLLEIDFYTLVSIIIQNPSFMYAHKNDIAKYFEYLQKEIDKTQLKEGVQVTNKYSCWALLDVHYKEDSILKIFDKTTV